MTAPNKKAYDEARDVYGSLSADDRRRVMDIVPREEAWSSLDEHAKLQVFIDAVKKVTESSSPTFGGTVYSTKDWGDLDLDTLNFLDTIPKGD